MKKIAVILITLLILLLAAAGAGEKRYKIGVLMWHEVSHDEQALSGFQEGLKLSQVSCEFEVKRDYEDEVKNRQHLRQWKEEKVDLICTIGTNLTLVALEEVKDIPIVFTAVTNPVVSGIAEGWESSGRNVTGSSNWIRAEELLKIFKGCIPHLKTLGVIYDANNPVPVAEVSEAKKVCIAFGIALKEARISSVDEVEKATRELIEQGIDALWVPREKIVYENISHVGRVTRPAKMPVVSSTIQGIDNSTGEAVGMLAVVVDYEALGRLCVPAAIEILTEGKNAGQIPILTMPRYKTILNLNAAEDIGYKIPPIFYAGADEIIKGFDGQKIIVGGTGDSEALLGKVASALEEKLGGGEIEVPESIGSSGGIKALKAGKIDLARVARSLKETEKAPDINFRIFAQSPIVLVVHPSVKGIDNLSTMQIIGIYSGEITDWAQLGAERGKIYAITRERGDSSLTILNKHIVGFKDITDPVAKVVYKTPDTVTTLTEHRNTIGFLPMSAAKETALRILKVDGVYPSMENVLSGKYKLLVPFGIVSRGEPEGLSRRFIDFLYSEEGKRIIAEMGTVPVGG